MLSNDFKTQEIDLMEILEGRRTKLATISFNVNQLTVSKCYESIDEADFADTILDKQVYISYRNELRTDSLKIKLYFCTPQRKKGKLPEWSIGTVSKTVERVTVPRVRISRFPQIKKP